MRRAPSAFHSLPISCSRSSSFYLETCLRRYSSESPKISPLPPAKEWKPLFGSQTPAIRDRVSIQNPETANRVAASFLSGESIAAGDKKIIIEAFPGKFLKILLSYTNFISSLAVVRSWRAFEGITRTSVQQSSEAHYFGRMGSILGVFKGRTNTS